MAKQVTDQQLLAAMRQRILNEIEKRQEQQAIINNVYGGGGDYQSRSSGVADQLGTASDGEDPYDYFVDITREDLPDINPATGKPAGWKKSVQRYRKKKGESEPPKKKILKDGN